MMQTMGSTSVNSTPSGMAAEVGTLSEAALMLLPLMTAVVCSPFIQLTTLPRNWALPPETAWLMLLSSRFGQLTQTTRAPVAELSAATATAKQPSGSVSAFWAVSAVA